MRLVAEQPGGRRGQPITHQRQVVALDIGREHLEAAVAHGGEEAVALGWDEMTLRLCRDLGGFEPDVAHRTNDATIATALVARGLAVTLLPELALALYGGVAVHPIAERPVSRMIFAATRVADAARPSTQALLQAIRYAASAEAAAASSA